MQNLRNLIVEKYRNSFPEELIPALDEYIQELNSQINYVFEGVEPEEVGYLQTIWYDFYLSLNKKEYYDDIEEEIKQLSLEESLKKYDSYIVYSYHTIKWLLENVPEYETLPLKLLSILDLTQIWKPDSVIIKDDTTYNCLVAERDEQLMQKEMVAINDKAPIYTIESTGYFTWPQELASLYCKKIN